MVAETDLLCRQSISVVDVQYQINVDSNSTVPFFSPSDDDVSFEISCSESVVSYSSSIQSTVVHSPSSKFLPHIRSGSHTDIGPRLYNEDEHICIDDLSAHMGYLFGSPMPSSFYAVFDGHGGPDAATFVKDNAMKIFFEEADLPQTSKIDKVFLKELENSYREAFLVADRAMADENSVPSSCGTTALTALVLGGHLIVANAGDCRAVLCRKGVPIQLSQDHRKSYISEKKRVENLGGYFEDEYLNGQLAVTRALGDWHMKFPVGSEKPLIAEPEITQILLTKDDEFLIVACDGVWDVMSNENAVKLVRRGLRKHNDPQQCAEELVNEALRLPNSYDNLTVIVVCFTKSVCQDSVPQRERRRFTLSEEARNKLSSLFGGN